MKKSTFENLIASLIVLIIGAIFGIALLVAEYKPVTQETIDNIYHYGQ